MGTFSIWHWIIVLIIAVIFFGSGRLRNLGSDLGESIKGFKKAMKDESSDNAQKKDNAQPEDEKNDKPQN